MFRIEPKASSLLKRGDLKTDPRTGKDHEIYSLRHTAICMYIVNSKGHVNIFTLKKKCRHFGRPDLTVLRKASADGAAAMEELAEFR